EQPVIELETDKATVEVPSSLAGTIADVKVAAGEHIAVRQVIFTISGDGAGAAEADASTADAAPKKDSGAVAATSDAVNDQDEGLPEGEAAAGEAVGDAPAAQDAGGGEGGRVEATLPSLGEGVNAAEVLGVLVK